METVARHVRRVFSIDLRSLALFRMGLGLLLLADLIDRARDLRVHYTDWGVAPRYAIDLFANEWQWSLHFISGRAEVMAALFVLAGVFALMLFAGYRTRLATVLSWLLLISLHERNFMLLYGADEMLRMLLFWSMFLPLGAYYSVDSALNSSTEPKPKMLLNLCGFFMLAQMFMVYVVTAVFKSGAAWHADGTALYYALSLERFTTPVGLWVLHWPPELLKRMTQSIWWLEMVGPFLLFCPVFFTPVRLLTILAFVSLHVGLWLTMGLGIFPWVNWLAFTIFIPSGFWNRVLEKLKTPERSGMVIYYDGDCGFCKKMVYLIRTFWLIPEVALQVAQNDPERFAQLQAENSWVVVDHLGQTHYKFEALLYVMRQSPVLWWLALLLKRPLFAEPGTAAYEWVANHRKMSARFVRCLSFNELRYHTPLSAQALALYAFICVLIWNLTVLDKPVIKEQPEWARRSSLFLGLNQYWRMFAPQPPDEDGWFVIPGKLFDGREVDIYRAGAPASFAKPLLVSAEYKNKRWHKFLENIWLAKNADKRLYYGRYLCRQWNDTHSGNERLDTFKIYFVLEKTLPHYQTAPLEPVMLWEHHCWDKRPE